MLKSSIYFDIRDWAFYEVVNFIKVDRSVVKLAHNWAGRAKETSQIVFFGVLINVTHSF